MGARRSRPVTAVVTAVVAGAAVAAGVALGSPSSAAEPVVLTANATGTHDGFFYSYWKDTGSLTMALQDAGRYTAGWTPSANEFEIGKGWQVGAPRTIVYSATMRVAGLTSLGVQGWTREPLTEYRIIDSWTAWNPTTGATKLGVVVSDGGVYEIYRSRVTSMLDRAPAGSAGPAMIPNSYDVYTSLRLTKRTAGTITVADHVAAWAAYGFTVGRWDQQLLAVAGHQSSGSADVTVAEAEIAPSPGTTSPTPTASVTPTGTPTSTGPRPKPTRVVTTTVTRCRAPKKGPEKCRTLTRKTRVPATQG
ncbi:MAG: glycoside hydrolase family 11 protein [Kineosporiaceae bacterium]